MGSSQANLRVAELLLEQNKESEAGRATLTHVELGQREFSVGNINLINGFLQVINYLTKCKLTLSYNYS